MKRVNLFILIWISATWSFYLNALDVNERSKTNIKDPFANFNDYLDKSVDPCTDFVAYTCRKFKEETETKNMDSLREIKKARNNVHRCIKNSILSNNPTNSSSIIKMRQFRDKLGCSKHHNNWSTEKFNLSQTLFKIYIKTGRMYVLEFFGKENGAVRFYFNILFDTTNNAEFNVYTGDAFSKLVNFLTFKNKTRSFKHSKPKTLVDRFNHFKSGGYANETEFIVYLKAEINVLVERYLNISDYKLNEDLLFLWYEYHDTLRSKQSLINYVCNSYLEDNTRYTITPPDLNDTQIIDLFTFKFPYVVNFLFHHECFGKQIGHLTHQVGGKLKNQFELLLAANNLKGTQKGREISNLLKDAFKLLNILNNSDINEIDDYYNALVFNSNDTLRQFRRNFNFFITESILNKTLKTSAYDELSQRMETYKNFYDFSTKNLLYLASNETDGKSNEQLISYAINGVFVGKLLIYLMPLNNIYTSFDSNRNKYHCDSAKNRLDFESKSPFGFVSKTVCFNNHECSRFKVYSELVQQQSPLLIQSAFKAYADNETTSYTEDLRQFFQVYGFAQCGLITSKNTSTYTSIKKDDFIKNLQSVYAFSKVFNCSKDIYKQRNKCNSCQYKQFVSTTDEYLCANCPVKCESCRFNSTINKPYCTKCYDYELQTSTVDNRKCVIECPTGTYTIKNEFPPHMCIFCKSECLKGCDGPSNFLTNNGCKRCKIGVLRVKPENEQFAYPMDPIVDGNKIISNKEHVIECLNVSTDCVNNNTCMDNIRNAYALNNHFLYKTSIKYNNLEFTIPVFAPCPNGTGIVLNDREEQKCYVSVFDAHLIYFISRYLWLTLGVVAILLIVLSIVSLLVRQIIEQRRYMNPVKGFKFEKPQKRIEKVPKHYEIQKEDLEYDCNNPIGKGAFGLVYKGIWKHNGEKYKVAIKQITEFSDFQDKHEERQLLFNVKHDHIVQFIGVCVKSGNVKIITAYRDYGSLRKLLTTDEHRSKVEPSYLVAYCHQVAKAMDYLANKQLIHCDLATRNILVRHLMHVEICDFGMSQALGSTVLQEQIERLPLEWLAIELLNPNEPILKYTVATDVWAYGVTMWEIFTWCGETPYVELDLDNKEKKVARKMLYDLLNNDKFLKKPKICRPTLRDLMLCCWDKTPRKRSSFHYFVQKFEGYLKNSIDMYIDLDEFANKPKTNGQIIEIESVAGNHFVLEKASRTVNNQVEQDSFVQMRRPNTFTPKTPLLHNNQTGNESCSSAYSTNTVATEETLC